MKTVFKVCSRGHKFKHSSQCPVCPICWPEYYKKHGSRDFDILSAPAQRALHNAGIKSLKQLSTKTEKEIFSLHGMGPNAMKKLKEKLKENNFSFKKF